jgi:hypothetical protein
MTVKQLRKALKNLPDDLEVRTNVDPYCTYMFDVDEVVTTVPGECFLHAMPDDPESLGDLGQEMYEAWREFYFGDEEDSVLESSDLEEDEEPVKKPARLRRKATVLNRQQKGELTNGKEHC